MEECLIHIYWTHSGGENGHRLRRDDRGADLGMPPPDPPFAPDEIEAILFAAKMAAIKCIRKRRKAKE